MKKIEGSYIPTNVESGMYDFWEKKGYFTANNKDTSPSYTVILPPPNVTGILHIGHVLNMSVQDTIIRHRRMSGYNTLWLPGTDHAGIATQNKVERMLADMGTSKEEIGYDKFLEKTWEWKNKYGNIITTQLRKVGASLDWSREKFTMDPEINEAVKEVFVRLYNDGLIYKGEYIVNWCPKDMTALADDEIEHAQKNGHIWHIKYPIVDSDEVFVIATTRPETMLGDSAVAVNPNDERYKHLIGKMVKLPLTDRLIPIIADDYVDLEFGTGAVKMTPSHDPNDFLVGKRHNLEFINIMTRDAKINEKGGVYQGLDRFEARAKIVSDLEELGLLVKIEKHVNNVGHCYRCDTIIEPRVSNQWFVKMEPLAKPALEAVRSGKIQLSPKRTEKIYYNWLENIRDWCISRQIWWGHQIPAYYDENGNCYVAKSLEEAQKMAPENAVLTQETDVLDTWFSSALWPFTTLGWPDDTLDLSTYFPTSSLVTGADIIFFWVARMIMMSLYIKKEIPFEKVFFTGIVRDEIGRKMSKSLGNSPDPLDIIQNKGADALRFGLLYNTSPGLDIKFSDKLIDMGSNFVNKIWNASKFVLLNLEGFDFNTEASRENFKMEDKWIISRLNRVAGQINEDISNYDLDKAIKKVYELFKNDYCDWYLEIAKTRVYNHADLEDKKTAQYVLRYCLEEMLKIMHPFIPYITEYIWQEIKILGESISISKYPVEDKEFVDDEIEKEFEFLKESISNIRNIRAESNVAPSKKVDIIINSDVKTEEEILVKNIKILEKLANVVSVTVDTNIPELVASKVVYNTNIYVPLKDLINVEEEIAKIQKDIDKVNVELKRVVGKLNNPKFMEKAPLNIVEKEKAIEKELLDKLARLNENLEKFKQGEK